MGTHRADDSDGQRDVGDVGGSGDEEVSTYYYWTHEIESPTNAGLIGRFLPPANLLGGR